MKKKKKLSLLQKRALTGFAFITPWLIGFLWFYVKSLIQAVRFSLSKMEMLESGGYTLKFTGLDNFKYALFQDPTYNQILATSIRDIVIDVPLIIFFSLFIAMICNGKFKGRTLVRAILFLPIIMNAGAINNAIEMAREAVTGGVAASICGGGSCIGCECRLFYEPVYGSRISGCTARLYHSGSRTDL